MVVINGIKYACERCIRGHRVSGCSHTDVLLKMIKKKGRPPSGLRNKRVNRGEGVHHSRPGGIPSASTSSSGESTTRPYSSGDDCDDQTPPTDVNDGFPKSTLTPRELAQLCRRPSITVELSDGTILGRNGSAHKRHRRNSYDSARDVSESTAEEGYSEPPVYGHEHGQLMVTPIPPETLLAADRFRYQPGVYGQLAGPYNADLYNASTGNNAVAAAINASGGGDYDPNTGSVSFQPKLILDNELSVSAHELVHSIPQSTNLHNRPAISPMTTVATAPATTSPGEPQKLDPENDVCHDGASIPKLSSLY